MLLFILIVPPVYSLNHDTVVMEAGSSHLLAFTVDSDPPLADNTVHSLTRDEAPTRFKVKNKCIAFHDVRVEDSGTYIISCCNDDGKVGEATIELEVTPPQPTIHHPPHSPEDAQPRRDTVKKICNGKDVIPEQI